MDTMELVKCVNDFPCEKLIEEPEPDELRMLSTTRKQGLNATTLWNFLEKYNRSQAGDDDIGEIPKETPLPLDQT